jgi:hypothetical protein
MAQLSPSSPALNRLRAAAGLIPLIEDGLTHSRIDNSKAESMVAFCQWATNHDITGSQEADRLTSNVITGIERLQEYLNGKIPLS